MNHNLYRANHYIVHRLGNNPNFDILENLYFSCFTHTAGEPVGLRFSGYRDHAFRIRGFSKLMMFFLLFHYRTQLQKLDYDLWNLKVDCCFSGGSFKTVDISELILKENFHLFYNRFLNDFEFFKLKSPPRFFRSLTNVILDSEDFAQCVITSIVEKSYHKKTPILLISPASNKSSDIQASACRDLKVHFQRLPIKDDQYFRGFLFKSIEDAQFCMLTVDFGKQIKLINLKDYAEIIENVLTKDKNYKDKISSTV